MQTMRSSFLALLSCSFLNACAPQSTSPAEGEDVSRRICATCRPLAGGQTSDFSGIYRECGYEESELSAADDASYGATDVREQLEAGITLPLIWGVVDPDEIWVGPPTERMGESVLQASFTLEDFQRFDSSSCPPMVAADVTVMFATDDGELQAEAHGSLVREEGSPYWLILATNDLSQVAGTLELGIDDTQIHAGNLVTQIYAHPNGTVNGEVLGRVQYYPSEEEYEADRAAAQAVLLGARHYVFYAWFPEDPRAQ